VQNDNDCVALFNKLCHAISDGGDALGIILFVESGLPESTGSPLQVEHPTACKLFREPIYKQEMVGVLYRAFINLYSSIYQPITLSLLLYKEL